MSHPRHSNKNDLLGAPGGLGAPGTPSIGSTRSIRSTRNTRSTKHRKHQKLLSATCTRLILISTVFPPFPSNFHTDYCTDDATATALVQNHISIWTCIFLVALDVILAVSQSVCVKSLQMLQIAIYNHSSRGRFRLEGVSINQVLLLHRYPG